MSIPWSSSQTLLTSAARTALVTGADITCQYARQIEVILDLTVNAGSAAALTITIQGKDPTSGKYYTLLASAAISSVGTTVYKVGIGLPATANVSANCGVPLTFRVNVAVGDASPATYSLGLNMIS